MEAIEKQIGQMLEDEADWLELERSNTVQVKEQLRLPSVRELVEHDDAGVVVGQRVAHEVAADEARAPGDEPGLHG